MSLFIEDTPRNNVAVWASEATGIANVEGVILSPFTSPLVGNTYKQGVPTTVHRLAEAGLVVHFDPATHALQMPAVGDFRYYDGWDLWGGGTRGDLTTPANQTDHVARTIDAARDHGMLPTAPTVLLSSATGAPSVLAASLAGIALQRDAEVWLTIAGTVEFWSSGGDLDAFVASMAQLGASGYSLVVARPTVDLPPTPDSNEIAGLCRTARALEQFGHVHISHGDFCGIPAVAAGATSVGTGWDSRQMVSSYKSYEARDPAPGGGGWLQRPTFIGLFGTMLRQRAAQLESQEPALSARLHPGSLHPDGPKEAFLHHVTVLGSLVDDLVGIDFEPAFWELDGLYEQAQVDWPNASAAAGIGSAVHVCVDPLREGLRLYGRDEGWL